MEHSKYLEWLERTAEDFVNEGGGISVGDIEAVAVACALTHGMDENAVINDLQNAIDSLLIPPNKEIVGLWDNDDLQRAIDFVKRDVAFYQQTIELVSDRRSVADVIKRGCAEDFDRYDSDVAEQFINAYLEVAESMW